MGSREGVHGISEFGVAVLGQSGNGVGVEGNSDLGAGVIGRSTDGVGAFFTSVSKEAVVGVSGGPGTACVALPAAAAVSEVILCGIGVFGDSERQSGVVGRSRGTSAPAFSDFARS